MNRPQHDEESIFKVAVKIESVEARTAYLKQVCGDDPVLFERVLNLLRVHDEEAGFLEQPVGGILETANMLPITEQAGSLIGPYKLLQQIGEGGFGVVYMAEQTRPVRRKVALKIIKPGMDTKEVIARFEAERQALALMDHPNIAKVLDAGATDSQRPYFVMELVKGVPLTEYCDKNHLPTRERLKLFVDVCHAIQHAHQKGVIHRDLKPSNIMVTLHDGKPVPKVIDFGVSKALSQQLTEKTLFTAYGQMVGTPAYMSPEQAEMSGLDIDTRSDVYSLGVLLYELLTGTTPFDGTRLRSAGYVEMQRIIREEEPPRPSTRLTSLGESSTVISSNRGTDPKHLGQLLRGELDWIVMKALDKDRNRRYETANGIAADVERYLNDESVTACPPTAAYRFRKFARRYKAHVTVAAAFALLLVASTALAWWLYADARVARNYAVTARDDLRQERDRAVDAERQAEQESLLAKQQRDRAEAERQRAEEEEQRAEAEKLRADRNADELKLRLYNYNLINAHNALEREDIGRTLALLDDCLPEQRRWEWHRLQRLAGGRRTLKLPGTEFTAFAVSPTEPRIVVFDNNAGEYRLFDLDTGKQLASGETGLGMHMFAMFAPAGNRVVVASVDDMDRSRPTTDRIPVTTLQVWEVATGQKLWETRRESELAYLAFFSPDGRSLASGGVEVNTGKSTVQLIDIDGRKQIWQHSPKSHGLPIATFAPDGKRLYVNVCETPTGRATLHCWSVDGPAEIWSVSDIPACVPLPTPDGSEVITGGPNHSLRTLDATDGTLIEEIPGGRPDGAAYFAFSPDGRYLVSHGHLGHRLVWDWEERTIVKSLPAGESMETALSIAAFTATSDEVVVASGPGAIDIRDIHPPPAQLILAGHEQAVKGVAFSPDGQHVASVSRDGTLRTWSTTTGQELHTLPAHTNAFDLSYSRDGSRIATGGNDGAKVWSAESGRLLHHWPDAGPTWWLDFNPDGGRVMTGGAFNAGHGVVSLFDATGGQTLFTREFTRWIDGVVFCADGRYAVSLLHQSGQLDAWDLESGEAKTIRPGAPAPDFMRCLVRNPRANQVAFVIKSTIELWDMDRRQLVNTLQVDGEPLYCLGFNHDGSRLFSGDTGGVVKVWDLDTNAGLYTMQAHESLHTPVERRLLGVTSLTISPDGNTLATGGADGLVKLWETTRPSDSVAEQRRIVREASDAVNQRYHASPHHGDVMASLQADSYLDKDVVQTAIEIADARGDRPSGPFVIPTDETELAHVEVRERLDEARRSFAALVEEASQADFDGVDPNSPAECGGQWVWDANVHVIPDFTLDELEFLLDPLVEQYPEAHQFLCLRGFVNGHRGRYEEAGADFAEALERVPEKTGLWTKYAYLLSTLYVHQEDFDRYRALSERALDQALEMDEPRLFELTAKMYLFSRHGGSRIDDAVHIARSASTGVSSYIFRWTSLAAGIAEYRRGNWELAIEILNQAQAPIGSQRPTRSAAANLFQALAYAQLGEHARARAKQAAAEWIMSRPGYGERDWWNAFIADAAHEEVQQFFVNAGDDADPATAQDSEIATKPRSQRIVSPDSEWKWLHPPNGIDPSSEAPDFHATFCSPAYDDTHWQTGSDSPGARGGFGYGDPAGVEFDVPAEGDRKTAYFRHGFTTDRTYDELIISMQRDDGVIVYLDGKEVGRNNVTDDDEAYDLIAPADVGGGQESWIGFYSLSGSLEPGQHVLAISLHNASPTNPDLRIAEMSLWGTPRN